MLSQELYRHQHGSSLETNWAEFGVLVKFISPGPQRPRRMQLLIPQRMTTVHSSLPLNRPNKRTKVMAFNYALSQWMAACMGKEGSREYASASFALISLRSNDWSTQVHREIFSSTYPTVSIRNPTKSPI